MLSGVKKDASVTTLDTRGEIMDRPAGAPSIRYKYIVLRHPDDCPGWKNSITKLHDNVQSAETEAKRLSVQHMNTRFCIAVIYAHYISYAETKKVDHVPVI